MEVRILIDLMDSPGFVAGLACSNDSGRLRVEVAKTSGSDYGFVQLTREEVLRLLDLLGVK